MNAYFFPHVPPISLELTNKCNLSCPYCGNSQLTRARGVIAWDLLEKVVDECADGHHDLAWLHGTGEPLIWDRLEDVIRLIKKRGAGEASFGTNGTLLTEKRVRSLLDSGLTSIYISLDSLDPAVYKSTRGADLKKVVENVKKLIKIVPKKFKITVALMEHKEQHFTLQLIQKFYDTFGFITNVHLNLVGNSLFPHAPEDYRVNKTDRSSCLTPRSYFTITLDGRVSICCSDQDVGHCLGDVHTQTIDEIWFNPTNQETFRKLALGLSGCPDICVQRCNIVEKNANAPKQFHPALLMPFDQALTAAHQSFLAGDLVSAQKSLSMLKLRNPWSEEISHFEKILALC